MKIRDENLNIENKEIATQMNEIQNDLIRRKNHRQEHVIETLKFIKAEFLIKLREYYYFEEELFPDFENRVHYLSKKYGKNETTKFDLSDNTSIEN
ncbi:hypothetical protein JDW15_10110 [Aerococcaceae bacterium zg-ZJ1578]|uniref:hypothetical protein n=1 Tax=Aerococcaceae bacterium zg-252 TaxID=2796928 RepID=UPI001A26E8C2|nr:hypothetical protein [Aerococcaceae bacterium zg-1578]